MRVRSGYSFRTAVGHLPELMERVKELGWGAAPITDYMSTFGFTRWTKLCEKAELKPVYGVQIPCVVAFGDRKPIMDTWTFIAQDSLRPLHELIYKATCSPDREPTLLYRQAMAAEGVFIVAGERLLVDKLPATPGPNFAMALAPSTPKGLIRRAQKAGIQLIASSDNYYPTEADKEFYRVALGFRSGTQTYPMHLMTDAEWWDFMVNDVGVEPDVATQAQALRMSWIADSNAKLKKAQLYSPEKPLTLMQMCQEGAKARGIDLSDPVYSERVERELRVIAEKNFEDYFYILADIIAWAKDRMVVGPARGSSCGSLVCYLLGITAIDPIPYDLIFERFIDINRMDLPDIDVDFSDVNRGMVFDYAEQRFGKDKVARLGTVGMFKARSALNQAGITLQIPKWRIDKLTDSIIERSSGDSRAMNSLEDTLKETDAGKAIIHEHPEILIATRMEGHPQLSSQHAAGLLLTAEPMTEYVAVDARTKAAWCDKKDAEDLNLLKIDALGLTQLSVFERTLELIGEKPISGWLEQIPLDDPAAFAVLNKGMYSGIFQVTGSAVRNLAEQINFTRLDDLVALGAIARPGPLASGGAHAWIKRRAGEPYDPPKHPLLAALTADTYGVVIYQETVMRITRELGQFSWADTARIRKLMSARMGDEAFEQWWEKFRDGAVANGMPEADAREVWKQINSFGSWAFNKSHAVAYGLISYWCAWLKAHHPLEFAAATLDAESDPNKQLALLRELNAEGIKYVAVDPDHSTDRWAVAERDGQRMLVGPLTAVKGIGPAKVKEILDARKNGTALKPGIAKALANAKTAVDSLFPVTDRIKELHPDLTKINIFTDPTPIIDVQPGQIRGEFLIMAKAVKISPVDENEPHKVEKRGGRRLSGPTASLNMFFADDTDEIFVKVDRYDYERIAPKVLEQGKSGKSLFAIKGTCPPDFRMVKVKMMRYLGEVE